MRKAFVVSKKLGITEAEIWINLELNGYSDSTKIPSYRIIYGEVKVWNPYRGWQPLHFENAKQADAFSRRPISQPISELDSLISNEKGNLHVPFSQDISNMLMNSMEIALNPSLHVSRTQLVGILDAVRNNILNWAIELEQKGILGEGMSFSKEEKSAASQVTYQITNNIGNMSNSQLQQHSPGSSQAITQTLDTAPIMALLGELKSAMNTLQLNANDLAELQAELNTINSQVDSPKPKASILHESFKSVRTILEGAAGSLVASDLIPKITAVLHLLV